jgi:hypothetical protein
VWPICRKEKSFNKHNKQNYVHGVYHLDFNATPIETKIYTDKKHMRVGSLPYGHFVVMVENSTSHHSDMVFTEPGGRAFIVYNKHKVAVQKADASDGVPKGYSAHSRCIAEENGWEIKRAENNTEQADGLILNKR